MKIFFTTLILGGVLSQTTPAQIYFSAGTYSQNFDTLASAGTVNWTNNVTLAGWYAAEGTAEAPTYIASAGTATTGNIYSFGTNGVHPAAERALGSVAGSGNANACGARFTNDTVFAISNLTIAFTGEQWRNANGTGAITNTLAFSYRISATPLTNADAINAQSWNAFNALDFYSPVVNVGGSGTALDGNAAANHLLFTNIVLAGAMVPPGQELFLRWRDVDDGGSDAGMAVDDLTVNFQLVVAVTGTPPVITAHPQNQSVMAGEDVIFSVAASGTPVLLYQWQFNGTNLQNETNAMLTLNAVSTGQSGNYQVGISNAFGATNSQIATLAVNAPPPVFAGTNTSLTLMTYNVKGNGVADWSTNAAQAQAIGRQLLHLKPDVITFNEIPRSNVWQMANWVSAFMPGYFIATNSGNDGFINCVIASRHPIIRSKSWLDGASLNPFGYTNTSSSVADNFTRDLFEAEINVPNWSLPLHVYTTHLKSSSGGYTEAAAKRAAEAAAITNFFATNLLVLYPDHPFTLSGDMNESNTNTLAVQRLISSPTALRLTNPTNPFSGSINTYSIQGSVSDRIDYIFPCAQLASNILASQVFRTDLLTNFPPNLFSNDDKIASDHLPVLMTFANPFNTPFQITAIARTNQGLTLKWESATNRFYSVNASSNLTQWTVMASNLFATGTNYTFTTNTLAGTEKFFRVHRVP